MSYDDDDILGIQSCGTSGCFHMYFKENYRDMLFQWLASHTPIKFSYCLQKDIESPKKSAYIYLSRRERTANLQ